MLYICIYLRNSYFFIYKDNVRYLHGKYDNYNIHTYIIYIFEYN